MEKSNIAVSVCISTYKHLKYIRQCLDSVMRQKFDHEFEVFVSDDCSNDGTLDILKEFKERYPHNFHYIVSPQNVGTSRNFYQSTLSASGKYICTFEADDWWYDEYKLQKQFDFLESHPEYVAVGSNTYTCDEDGNNLKINLARWQLNKKYTLKDYLKYGFTIHGNTLMYRNVLPYNSKEYKDLIFAERTMCDIIIRVLLYDAGPIYVLKDAMYVRRDGLQNHESYSYQSRSKLIDYTYMYFRIVDNLEKYLNHKYDLSSLKANRFSLVIKSYYFDKKTFSIDKAEFKKIKKSLPRKVLFKAYAKMIRNLFLGFFKKVSKKIHRDVK